MLLPAINGIGDDVAGRLAQDVLLRHAVNLLVRRLRANNFHDLVVEERHPPLDGVRHLHAVAEHRQDVAGQHGLRPQVKRLVHGLTSGKLAADVHLVEERAEPLALRRTCSRKSPASTGRIFSARAENVSIQEGQTQSALRRRAAPLAVRQQQAAGDRIEPFQLLEQSRDRARILALRL